MLHIAYTYVCVYCRIDSSFFLDVTKLYLHLCATVYLVAAWILLVKACVGVWSARKSKTRNTARTEEPARDSGRDSRRTVVPEDGKRRKREAPNTQHNPAASSASMDFKRSPRLLLFPFLSFSFFYYYFREADGCALAPAHGVCVHHVCTCTCVHIRACIYVFTRPRLS